MRTTPKRPRPTKPDASRTITRYRAALPGSAALLLRPSAGRPRIVDNISPSTCDGKDSETPTSYRIPAARLDRMTGNDRKLPPRSSPLAGRGTAEGGGGGYRPDAPLKDATPLRQRFALPPPRKRGGSERSTPHPKSDSHHPSRAPLESVLFKLIVALESRALLSAPFDRLRKRQLFSLSRKDPGGRNNARFTPPCATGCGLRVWPDTAPCRRAGAGLRRCLRRQRPPGRC